MTFKLFFTEVTGTLHCFSQTFYDETLPRYGPGEAETNIRFVQDMSTPFDIAESLDNAALLVVDQPLDIVIRRQREERDEREQSQRPV
jgi:hypothetical protein